MMDKNQCNHSASSAAPKRQETSLPVMEDYYRIHHISQPAFHASGERWACTDCHWDCLPARRKDQKYISSIYTAAAKPDAIPCQVTAGGDTEHSPAFSADGRWLYFISNASGLPQVWRRRLPPLDGGSAPSCEEIPTRLTDFRHGVLSFSPSPDDRYLLVFTELWPQEKPEDLRGQWTGEELDAYRRAQDKLPWIAEDAVYKSDADMGYIRPRKNLLFLVEPNSGNACLVGGCEGRIHPPLWETPKLPPFFHPGPDAETGSSPAPSFLYMEESSDGLKLCGAQILCGTSSRESRQDTLPLRRHELLLEGEPLSPSGPGFLLKKARGGSALLFAAQLPWQIMDGNTALFLLEAGHRTPRPLWDTKTQEYGVCAPLSANAWYGKASDTYQVSADGQNTLFLSPRHGFVPLYSMPLSVYAGEGTAAAKGPATGEETASARQITQGRHHLRCITEERDGYLLAVHADPLHLPRLVRLSADTGAMEVLYDPNSWLEAKKRIVPQEITIPTADGLGSVQGWILPPSGEEMANGQDSSPERCPAILFVHGGPAMFYAEGLNYEFQALSAAGFAVLYANPRGSAGYGGAHSDFHYAYDGTAMYDLLGFLDAALKRCPWIDPERIGICGGSYGGYMTIWAASHTDRFKAACAFRPLSNYLIVNASSHSAGQEHSRKEYDSYRDRMVQLLKESPVLYADKIHIPFQILQGTRDACCPAEQAHQLYVAIKDTHPDLPVRLVLYPDANHAMLQSGPLYLAVHHYLANLEWFRRWL